MLATTIMTPLPLHFDTFMRAFSLCVRAPQPLADNFTQIVLPPPSSSYSYCAPSPVILSQSLCARAYQARGFICRTVQQ